MRNSVFVLLMMAALVGTAAAATGLDELVEASPDAKVKVENLSGSVQVKAWDNPMVHVTGSVGRDTEGLEIKGGPDRIRIEVKIPRNPFERRGRDEYDSHLEISVPRGCSLDVETVSADIAVEGVSGELKLESVSGDIRLEAAAREAEIESVSGDITVSGEIPRLKAESVSGRLELDGVSGQLEASSVSGDINVQAGLLERASMESVSGEISLSGDLSANARVDLESHSGGVELRLPSGVAAEFRVSTFSGHIDSNLGGEPDRTGNYLPSKELSFSTGSGGASVEIDTFSGNINLRTH